MHSTLDLLRQEPRARLFLAAHAQSSLGTGAGYVALLLLAYERMPSPLAISLVLVADLLPAMVLGPLLGAAADRWSRRWCAVVADVLRAAAFLALGLGGGIEVTVALALLAGTGTALFTPAALAGLPSLVKPARLPAANSLFACVADLGHTVGPALAGLVLLLAGPETLVIANGATFAISAAVLAALPFGERPAPGPAGRKSLAREAREGLRAAARLPGIPAMLGASSGMLLFAGVFNVAELPFATDELGLGGAGFSALVAVFGLGVIGGSLAGASGGARDRLKRRYLLGLWVVAAGFLAAAVAPVLAVALLAFGIAGVGNGLVVVHERLLIQRAVPDAVMGRIFGVKDAATAWAFAIAFSAGAPLVALLGARDAIMVAGLGGAATALLAGLMLRRAWRVERSPVPWRAAPALGSGP